MIPNLSIHGLGLYLPPAHAVVELASAAGADVTGYNSWRRVCVAASDNDQPSTMGVRALETALTDGGVERDRIRLVVFCGVSRDYPSSWSVATEIIALAGLSADCLGIDLTIGCAGALAALEYAQGWLAMRGGGLAAIVSAERWSYTIDFANPASRTWAWSDNGGAMIVGIGEDWPARATFVGAEWTTRADYNGHVMIAYGGSRAPLAPPGTTPYTRITSDRPRTEILDAYRRGYRASYDRLMERVGRRRVDRLICNQTSPVAVVMIAETLGIAPDDIVITGHDVGHLGSSDVMLGLSVALAEGRTEGLILLGTSTAYAYGVGLMVAAARD